MIVPIDLLPPILSDLLRQGSVHKPLRLTRAALSGDEVSTTTADMAFEPLWTLFRTHGSLRVMYLIADQPRLRSGQPPLPVQPSDSSISLAVAAAMEAIAR